MIRYYKHDNDISDKIIKRHEIIGDIKVEDIFKVWLYRDKDILGNQPYIYTTFIESNYDIINKEIVSIVELKPIVDISEEMMILVKDVSYIELSKLKNKIQNDQIELE